MGAARAEWGIVISRSFDATGVLEAFLPESNQYVHRLKFERRPVPPHIMEKLHQLSLNKEPATREDPTETQKLLAEDGIDWKPTEDLATTSEIAMPDTAQQQPEAAVELPIQDITDVEPSDDIVDVMSAQMRYEEAVQQHPDRAKAAMKVELQAMLDRSVWRGVHFKDIPVGERGFILRSMDGFKEKIRPNGEWERDKARVFVDGSVQKAEYTGESSSPVARIESIFAMAGIAAYMGWIVIKIDVTSAYLTTPRPDEVKYKYLRLSKELTAVLVELDPSYASFVDPRGCIIVLLDKMLYGMKESGLEFYRNIMDMFSKGGYKVNPADPCVVHRITTDGEIHGGIIVDDGMFLASNNEQVACLLAMYTEKFGPAPVGFTYTISETIDMLGMQFEFDRTMRQAIISQSGQVKSLLRDVGVTKFARLPATPDLFEAPVESPLLNPEDSDKYRSWNQSLMFLASRTYPECLPAATVAASRFHLATVEDMKRLRASISYLGRDPDHCLVIRPGSLSLVASADASYGVHMDGKSHGGECMGFKGCDGIPDAYFTFSSGKQSIVTKSSCESELVQSNKGADCLVWGTALLEGFGIKRNEPYVLYRNGDNTPYAHEDIKVPVLYQDNASAIHLIKYGRGNFRNTKHIRVRYYYIRDLVLAGEMLVSWLSTKDMVSDLLSKGVVWSVFCYLLPMLIGKR